MTSITHAQLNDLYGTPSASKRNQAVIEPPASSDLTVESSGRVQIVWAHELVAELFEQTLEAAANAAPDWQIRRIDSHVYRKIRGSSRYSMHSYGLAWDIFATSPLTPPPGGVWTPDAEVPADFVAMFEAAGFTWGGRWKRRDTPHFEWRHEPPAHTPPQTLAPDIDPAYTVVNVVSDLRAPGGGVWQLTRTGHIYGPGGAPYYGAPPDTHPADWLDRRAASLTAGNRDGDGTGYTVWSTDREPYEYPAP